VYGATGVAERIGVSEGIIGVTVVALGTSLPELAATIRAAIGKSSDIAVGNVVGSNIFNLLSVLGITSLVRPLSMSPAMEIHVWIMLGVSAALVVLATVRPKFGRLIGGAFLASYAAFIAFAYISAA
jgi:cation:H+ antiporter